MCLSAWWAFGGNSLVGRWFDISVLPAQRSFQVLPSCLNAPLSWWGNCSLSETNLMNMSNENDTECCDVVWFWYITHRCATCVISREQPSAVCKIGAFSGSTCPVPAAKASLLIVTDLAIGRQVMPCYLGHTNLILCCSGPTDPNFGNCHSIMIVCVDSSPR